MDQILRELKAMRAESEQNRQQVEANKKIIEEQQDTITRMRQNQIDDKTESINLLKSIQATVENQRKPSHPSQYSTVPSGEQDKLAAEARAQRTTRTVNAWLDTFTPTGAWALGKFFDEQRRHDAPYTIMKPYSEMVTMNMTTLRPVLAKYYERNRDVPIPSERELARFSPPHSNPADANLLPPANSTQPVKPVSAMDTAELTNFIKNTIQTSLPANGDASTLQHRARMMNTNFGNMPTALDPSSLYMPTVTPEKATKQIQDFMTGKTKTPFSLSTVRRATQPGAGPFDPKSRTHFITALNGLQSLIHTTIGEGKMIKDHESRLKEISLAIEHIGPIPDGDAIRSCANAWSQDFRLNGVFCGVSFTVEAKTAAATARKTTTTTTTRNNTTRNGKNRGPVVRCYTCRLTGHTADACPYAYLPQIPVEKICAAWNSGNCTSPTCNLLHICSFCRHVGIRHRLSSCKNPRRA